MHNENCLKLIRVYGQERGTVIYLLGGLSRASMSIYQQYPRFFFLCPVGMFNGWSSHPGLAGSIFPQKYHIFFTMLFIFLKICPEGYANGIFCFINKL